MKRYITEEQNDIKVGDIISIGKWKNHKVTVTGFGTDKNNQPTVLLSNGKEIALYHFRVNNLLPTNKK